MGSGGVLATGLGAFFAENMQVVQFVYGLSLFTLGLVVSLQPRRLSSRYTLAKSLGSLAGFAFLHAFADWGNVFIPLQALPHEAQLLSVLYGTKTLAEALSFMLLAHFGLSLLLPDRRAITTVSWAFLLSAGTFLLWLIAYVFYPVAVPRADVVGWFSAAEIWARYLLGLPSGLITAWGLVRQARELRRDNLHGHVRSLFVVAAFFGAYGLAAGLVVPGGSVWLAAIVNTETFQDVTGLPVQIVRGTAMLVVAFFTHQLLDIFNVETSRRLQRAEAEQAILKERERIARDLHDGIMQTLYGVGLGLRQVVDNPASGKEVAAALTAELSRALAELRGYVLGLREEGVSGNDLVRGVEEMVVQIRRFSGLHVSLDVEGFEPGAGGDVRLPAGVGQNVLAVLRESLSNVVRHAGVHTVRVLVAWEDDTIVLRVTDAGRGFTPGPRAAGDLAGYGLENMRQRVEQMHGLFHVTTAPGAGTEVMAQIPVPNAAPMAVGGTEHGSEG